MVLNKNGQVVFYTLMLAVVVVILALALTPIVNTFVSDARGNTTDTQLGLDCDNSTISDFTKSQCVLTDVATPYFFFGLIGIALLIIGAKVILGQ